MNFNLNSQGIAKYIKTLNKRYVEAERRITSQLLHNLYIYTPKQSGRLASNYYCVVNTTISHYDENKFSPTFEVPPFSINDQLYIVNETPYINFVNYGTIYQLPQNFIERSISTTKLQIPDLLKGLDRID